MSNSASVSAVSQRCGNDAGEKWQQLLRHLELSSGFSFVLLLVPDQELATFLRDSLAVELSSRCRLLSHSADTAPFIYQIPALISVAGRPKGEVIYWIDSLPHSSDQGGMEWRKAWHYVAARLNERREALRAQLQTALMLVGPPELEPLLREHAPDLWSVRALVARFGHQGPHTKPPRRVPDARPPPASGGAGGPSSEPTREEPTWRTAIIPDDIAKFFFSLGEPMTPAVVEQLGGELDPHKELVASARLRGRDDTASRHGLAEHLIRVACAFGARRDGPETERVAREAWAALNSTGQDENASIHQQILTAFCLALIGWGLLLRKRHSEALNYARLAFEQCYRCRASSSDERLQVRRAKLIAWDVRGHAAIGLNLPNDGVETVGEYLDMFDVDPRDLQTKLPMLLSRVPKLLLESNMADMESIVRFVLEPTRMHGLSLVERAQTHEWFADVLLRNRRAEEAAQELSHAALLREACGDASMTPLPIRYRASLHHEVAKQLFSADQPGVARPQAEMALRLYERSTSETQAERAELRLMQGAMDLLLQRYADGEAHLREAVQLCQEKSVPHRTRLLAIQSMTGALVLQGKVQAAETFLREQLDRLKETEAAAAEMASAQRQLRMLSKLAALRPEPLINAGVRLLAQTSGQLYLFRRWLRREVSRWRQ